MQISFQILSIVFVYTWSMVSTLLAENFRKSAYLQLLSFGGTLDPIVPPSHARMNVDCDSEFHEFPFCHYSISIAPQPWVLVNKFIK